MSNPEKGQLKVLYTDQLEFDSDEFDLQTLDWKDVAQLLSHVKMRVSIDAPRGPRVFDGVITVDGELVFAENTGAVSLYKKHGYKEMDRGPVDPHSRAFYSGEVLLMTCQA